MQSKNRRYYYTRGNFFTFKQVCYWPSSLKKASIKMSMSIIHKRLHPDRTNIIPCHVARSLYHVLVNFVVRDLSQLPAHGRKKHSCIWFDRCMARCIWDQNCSLRPITSRYAVFKRWQWPTTHGMNRKRIFAIAQPTNYFVRHVYRDKQRVATSERRIRLIASWLIEYYTNCMTSPASVRLPHRHIITYSPTYVMHGTWIERRGIHIYTAAIADYSKRHSQFALV